MGNVKPTEAWLDLETTGLEAFKVSPAGLTLHDVPLEIGLAVTDKWGRIVDTYEALIWKDEESAWHHARERARAHPIVGPMHEKSGLWADFADPFTDKRRPEQIEDEVIEWLTGHGIEKMTAPVWGSTVEFDRNMLAVYMPRLNDYFHYRTVNISSVKELCRRFNPEVYSHKDTAYVNTDKAHRVIADIEDSIAEFGFYVENFLFVPDDLE